MAKRLSAQIKKEILDLFVHSGFNIEILANKFECTSATITRNLKKELLEEINRNQSKEIQRPNYWGGYCLEPLEIEFWQGKDARLHDRLLYERINNEWITKRLSP